MTTTRAGARSRAPVTIVARASSDDDEARSSDAKRAVVAAVLAASIALGADAVLPEAAEAARSGTRGRRKFPRVEPGVAENERAEPNGAAGRWIRLRV